MLPLLIYLIIGSIIAISIKSIPYNFECNRSALRICIIDGIPFYTHQRALSLIIQPDSLQQFFRTQILLLSGGRVRILTAVTCCEQDRY